MKAPRRVTALALVGLLALVTLAPAQTWQSGPSIPTGGLGREFPAAVWTGSEIFLLGGTPLDGGGDAAAHRLSSAGTWSATTPLQGAFFHGGVAIDGPGRIVVIAGEDSGGGTGDTFHWTVADGDAGGLDERSSLAPAKHFAVATDATGRIYSFGGGDGAAATVSSPNSDRVERYEPVSDSWSALSPLPTAVAEAAACADGQGRILVIGGYDATGGPIANVAAYDVAAGTWSDTAVPDLPAARAGLRAVLGADGRVYAIGGTDGTLRTTTYILDVAANTWLTGPALATGRERFGCVLDGTGTIWVMGGTTAAGGTDTVETLFTPTCPVVTTPPAATTGFVGATVGLEVVVSGTAPFTYQWRRDGTPLNDGVTGHGSTIVGATEPSLGVLGTTWSDQGTYDCVIGNACGSTTTTAVLVDFVAPTPTPPGFVARVLPSLTGLSSEARSVDGGLVVGSSSYTHATYGTLSRPVLWSAAGGPAVDLTPSGSVGGAVSSVAGGVLAGWWWWPYNTPQGTGYHRHASVWLNGGTTHQDVQRSGWEYGSLADTDGTQHAGTQTYNDYSTTSDAFYWPTPTSLGPIKLTPPAAWGSSAAAVDGGFQFGSLNLGFGTLHAGKWNGSPSSVVDLNPIGGTFSYVLGAGSGQQVGRARFGTVDHAILWAGTTASAVSLRPPGAGTTEGRDAEGGLQVGTVSWNGQTHATLWIGSAASAVSLHGILPAIYSWSIAHGLDVDANGKVSIAGSAWNTATGRRDAILWVGRYPTFGPTPPVNPTTAPSSRGSRPGRFD